MVLIASAFLFFLTTVAGAFGTRGYMAAAAVAGCFCALSMACLSPLLALVAFVLAIVATCCFQSQTRFRRFFGATLLATLCCNSIGVVAAIDEVRTNARWRERYPFESMGPRLAYETQARQNAHALSTQPPEAALVPLELAIHEREKAWFSTDPLDGQKDRALALRRIHADYVLQFVDAPGLGVGRRIRPSTRWIELEEVPPVRLAWRAYEDPLQVDPGLGPKLAASTGPNGPAPGTPADAALGEMHRTSFLDFIYLKGFGYVKDRDHVAGFVSHRFRQLPEVDPGRKSVWSVNSLDLVSLLKHPDPVAYVSENLPRMDELPDASVRALNSFETSALIALRRGEDLEIQRNQDHIRMLGSIRAAKQCIECHQVQRGHLLGAFSYTLHRQSGQ